MYCLQYLQHMHFTCKSTTTPSTKGMMLFKTIKLTMNTTQSWSNAFCQCTGSSHWKNISCRLFIHGIILGRETRNWLPTPRHHHHHHAARRRNLPFWPASSVSTSALPAHLKFSRVFFFKRPCCFKRFFWGSPQVSHQRVYQNIAAKARTACFLNFKFWFTWCTTGGCPTLGKLEEETSCNKAVFFSKTFFTMVWATTANTSRNSWIMSPILQGWDKIWSGWLRHQTVEINADWGYHYRYCDVIFHRYSVIESSMFAFNFVESFLRNINTLLDAYQSWRYSLLSDS